MAVSLDKLFPRVLPFVPSCPDISVRLALAEAAAIFCDDTHVWREVTPSDTTIAGDGEISFAVSGVVAAVLGLVVSGTEMSRVDDRAVPLTQMNTQGVPRRYWLVGDDRARLHPVPDDAYDFYASLAVKPRKDATTIEDFLYESYGDVLAYGALWLLQSIPGKDWTNLPLSEHYRRQFEHGMANARVRDLRNVNLRVSPRPLV